LCLVSKLPIVKKGRSVEIAATRGVALGDDLGAVTGTSLDKGVELDALAKKRPGSKKRPGPNVEQRSSGRALAHEPVKAQLVNEVLTPDHFFLDLTAAPPPFSAMNSLVTPAGRLDRRAVMTEAHRRFRLMRRYGWSFGRCFAPRMGQGARAAGAPPCR
jgi:hypothetical protein